MHDSKPQWVILKGQTVGGLTVLWMHSPHVVAGWRSFYIIQNTIDGIEGSDSRRVYCVLMVFTTRSFCRLTAWHYVHVLFNKTFQNTVCTTMKRVDCAHPNALLKLHVPCNVMCTKCLCVQSTRPFPLPFYTITKLIVLTAHNVKCIKIIYGCPRAWPTVG